MRHPIPDSTRKEVVKRWLSGDIRDEIAADLGIAGGTVSSIIRELERGSYDREHEFQALRELAIQCKKKGIPITELTSSFRLNSIIKRMGADDVGEAETFLNNIYNNCLNGDSVSSKGGLPPEKLVRLTNELFTISTSESIAPAEVPSYVKQRFEEKHKLEETIKTLCDTKDKIEREVQELSRNKDAIARELDESKRMKNQLSEDSRSIRDIPMPLNPHNYRGADRFGAAEQQESHIRDIGYLVTQQSLNYHSKCRLCYKLASVQMDPDVIKILIDTIFEIADSEGLSIGRAVSRFLQDERFYCNRLELRKELEQLRTQIQIEITKLEQSIAANSLLDRAKCIVSSLLDKGLEDDQIITVCLNIHFFWDKISLETLPSDLEHYGSLKKAQTEIDMEIQRKRREVNSLKQEKRRPRKELDLDAVIEEVVDRTMGYLPSYSSPKNSYFDDNPSYDDS
jgi:hypothetical protein